MMHTAKNFILKNKLYFISGLFTLLVVFAANSTTNLAPLNSKNKVDFESWIAREKASLQNADDPRPLPVITLQIKDTNQVYSPAFPNDAGGKATMLRLLELAQEAEVYQFKTPDDAGKNSEFVLRIRRNDENMIFKLSEKFVRTNIKAALLVKLLTEYGSEG